MIEQLYNEINEKQKNIQELNDKINQFYRMHKVIVANCEFNI